MSAARERRSWGLPLTAKDLSEAAQRKRTYVVRVAVGLLFGAVLIAALRGGQARPGAGHDVLFVLTMLLCGTMVTIASLASASAIAGEREDGSLPLLRMTMLGPWTIIIEKWLSRLIPILGIALIATPLMALAYVLGGFELSLLGCAIAAILATAVHATAIGICASAWCRGTIGAVILTMIVLAVIYIVPLIVVSGQGFVQHAESTGSYSAPMITFSYMVEADRYGFGNNSFGVPVSFVTMFWQSCGLAVISAIVALVLARIGLTRRDTEATGNRLLGWFRGLDRWFERAEGRWSGRKIARELPERDPVAWRECHRRTLTSPRYLVRIMVPLAGVIVLAVVVVSAQMGYRNGASTTGMISVMTSAALLLTLVVFGATAFSAERSNETLPVLLTTPMTARDILRQKLSGLRRLHLAGSAMLLMLILLRGWMFSGSYDWDWRLAVVGAIVTPAIVTWVAILVGLIVRSRARAITTAVGTIIAWIVVGGLIVVLIDALTPHNADNWDERRLFQQSLFVALCPVALPYGNEMGGFRESHAIQLLSMYLIVYLPLWYGLRRLAFSLADRLLRRSAS